MKPIKKILLIFLLLTLSTGCSNNTPKVIKPDNTKLQYTGRIDFAKPQQPVFYWPGTQVSFRFKGTAATVRLEDSDGNDYYNVLIDSNFTQPLVLDCIKGDSIYTLAKNLPDTIHTIQLFKRTEDFAGHTIFHEIILNPGAKLLSPPLRPEHRILFYGNSITCGMGNECSDEEGDNDFSKRNNFLAYGAITARNLKTEYVCVSKSGIGIMISWFDLIMPQMYNRIAPYDSTREWDFSKGQPDVIVINLGQNDSWLIKKLDPVPDETEIITAYQTFIKTIRSKHPQAFIFCVLGTMDAIKPGSPWPGYITRAVGEYSKSADDQKIKSFIFSWQDFEKHPRVRHHKKMAAELTELIKTTMGW